MTADPTLRVPSPRPNVRAPLQRRDVEGSAPQAPTDLLEVAAPARWLARFVPRPARYGESVSSFLTSMGSAMRAAPQYHFLTRPVYRAAGGELQPLSAPIWSSIAADWVCHQALPRAYMALARGRSLGGFAPDPISTSIWVGYGFTTSMYKLGCFPEKVVLHNLTDALAGGRPEVAAAARKLLRQALDHRVDPRAMKWALLSFITRHDDTLPAEVRQFAHRLFDEDPEAEQQALTLWQATRRYAATGERSDLDAVLRAATEILPAGLRSDTARDPKALLQRDARQLRIIGALVTAQWALWLGFFTQGDQHALRDLQRAPEKLLSVFLYFVMLKAGATLCNLALEPGELQKTVDGVYVTLNGCRREMLDRLGLAQGFPRST